MYLREISIEGFWGRNRADTSLKRGVNIVIGENGTGKTTFISLVYAALTGDVATLLTTPFTRIKVKLTGEHGRVQTLRFEKDSKPTRPGRIILKCYIGNREAYKIDPLRILSEGLDAQTLHRRLRRHGVPEELASMLGGVVQVRWLSVHRYAPRDEDEERARASMAPADAKLRDLDRELRNYQLQLAQQVNDASTKFQQDVLRLMLYSADMDTVADPPSLADLPRLRDLLTRAYAELHIPREEIQKGIDDHIRALKAAIEDLFKPLPAKGTVSTVDAFLAIPLLNRTRKLAGLVSALERRKTQILKKREEYLATICSFLLDKEIGMDDFGSLRIGLLASGTPLTLESLSSGEKQLLIHLTEALVQAEQPCVFIGDEPELSMHIQWQRRLLASMARLNPKAQILVATHSPEIVGSFRDRVTDMRDIVKEEPTLGSVKLDARRPSKPASVRAR